jgi:hypothetical protein
VERGVANETAALVEFLNARAAGDAFNRADFETVRALASTCVTGCRIVDPGPVPEPPVYDGVRLRLAERARAASRRTGSKRAS